MKNIYLQIIGFLFVSSGLSTATFAQCPTSLAYDDLVTCIVVEGSGQPYDEFLVEWDKAVTSQTGRAEENVEKAESESRYLLSSANSD